MGEVSAPAHANRTLSWQGAGAVFFALFWGVYWLNDTTDLRWAGLALGWAVLALGAILGRQQVKANATGVTCKNLVRSKTTPWAQFSDVAPGAPKSRPDRLIYSRISGKEITARWTTREEYEQVRSWWEASREDSGSASAGGAT